MKTLCIKNWIHKKNGTGTHIELFEYIIDNIGQQP